MAARLDRPEGVRRIFEVKERDKGQALPVIVSGSRQAETLGQFDNRARRLATAFWPGALTIVVRRDPGIQGDLGGDPNTIGLRAPDHSFLQRLIPLCGPLVTTSANPSGSPTPMEVQEIADLFGSSVALYIDGGRLQERPPSTVISLVSEEPKLLREGPVGWADILRVL